MHRPKRKAADLAEGKIKNVLDWESCNETSELWKQVELKFNEEYEGRLEVNDEEEEEGDFDCEDSCEDSDDGSLASDDSMNKFIVDSSQESSQHSDSYQENDEEEASAPSESDEDVDTDELVSEDSECSTGEGEASLKENHSQLFTDNA